MVNVSFKIFLMSVFSVTLYFWLAEGLCTEIAANHNKAFSIYTWITVETKFCLLVSICWISVLPPMLSPYEGICWLKSSWACCYLKTFLFVLQFLRVILGWFIGTWPILPTPYFHLACSGKRYSLLFMRRNLIIRWCSSLV